MVPGRFAYKGQGRRDLPEERSEQLEVGTTSYPGRLPAGPAGLLRPVSVHLVAVAAVVPALQISGAVSTLISAVTRWMFRCPLGPVPALTNSPRHRGPAGEPIWAAAQRGRDGRRALGPARLNGYNDGNGDTRDSV